MIRYKNVSELRRRVLQLQRFRGVDFRSTDTQVDNSRSPDALNMMAGENVYLDTAFTFDFIEQEMFLKVLNKHDENKILFATDSPWSHAKRDIEAVKNLPVKDEIKQKIFSENAKKLLELY